MYANVVKSREMRGICRKIGAFSLLAGTIFVSGCQHPAERALEGHWWGQGVENFEHHMIASATGWARGTTLEFEHSRLTIQVPDEAPRTGTYRLMAIDDRRIDLAVMDPEGQQSEISVYVDDSDTLRWALGDGKTMILKRQ